MLVFRGVMPLNTSYEIHALVKKKWKLLACISSSQAAIEDAIALQQNEKYAAVRVMARPMDQAHDDSPRLIYQFTRPGHGAGDPPPDRIDFGAADARLDQQPRPRLWPLRYWIAAALVLLLGFEGCA